MPMAATLETFLGEPDSNPSYEFRLIAKQPFAWLQSQHTPFSMNGVFSVMNANLEGGAPRVSKAIPGTHLQSDQLA